jgi:GMP synthase-like glutamine amidotransferase
MKGILCLQHVAFEGPGAIAEWAALRDMPLRIWRMDEHQYAPEDTESDQLIVVLGGPMNVDDEAMHPWLCEEKQFLFRQLNRRARILGICLGAQIMAHLLGAEVRRQKEKEIGWFPVRWTSEAQAHPFFKGVGESSTVLHWHEQGFGLPPMAQRLASSEACPEQGFVWKNRVVGLQFHLEMGLDEARLLTDYAGDDLAAGGRFVQPREALLTSANVTASKALLFQLLDGFFLPLSGRDNHND